MILVSSFNHSRLEAVRRRDPRIRLGVLITGPPGDAAAVAVGLGAYSVHLSLEFIDRAFVADARSRRLRVFVFTVNHPDDIRRMEGLGVDGVFTNYPERVLQHQKTGGVIGWA